MSSTSSSNNNNKGAEDAPNMRTVSFFPAATQLAWYGRYRAPHLSVCASVCVCVTTKTTTTVTKADINNGVALEPSQGDRAVKVCDACDINQQRQCEFVNGREREGKGRAEQGQEGQQRLTEL